MKKIFLLLLLASPVRFHAQPKLVGALSYSGTKEGGSVFRYDLPASTPGILHVFDNLAPHRPTGVCAGNGNWLYGMLAFNGTSNSGGLYKIQTDGTGFVILYNLSYPSLMIPYYHTDGYIYFTDAGQIKKLSPSDNSVTDVGGSADVKTLLIDSDDWIYTTNGFSIDKIKTDGTGASTLHTFVSATEGSAGRAGLIETAGDSLFGVQIYEGSFTGGTLYSIKKDGSGFTVLHQFSTASGIYPESKLVYFDGKLYGTTTQGGDHNDGVLYSINPDGSNYRVLLNFDPGTPAIGSIAGNISITSNGRIFGTFYQHYFVNAGTANRLFKVDTSGTGFETFFLVSQRENGALNQDILMTDDETIYIPTLEIGRHDGGVLNRTDTFGNATALYHFGFSNNGFRPSGGLIKASDGKLYGTTKIGGVDGAGIIYSMNQDGTAYTKLHELSDAEGYDPWGKLLEASDGKLYGVCQWGGPINAGSIFRLNKNGTGFQVIYTFPDFLTSGYNPSGSLVEDNSGVLYGATFYGGAGYGVIFKINKDGTDYTVLKIFNSTPDLAFPYNGLTLSGNYLYGAGGYGGTQNKGGIFRIKTDGSAYEVLHEFNGTDGEHPSAIPIIASNGKIYGTADYGGNNTEGVVFRMDISGSNFTVLKHFSTTVDGGYPTGGLIQGSDGLIYGTASQSNLSGDMGGTIYKMNLDGSGFTLLHSFNLETEGQSAVFLLDLNGNFTALPVQFITFSAKKSGVSALLSWQTAIEQNSDHFEIERSTDGNAFALIAKIAANKNTSTVSSYNFSDLHPNQGINFYRLKEVDLDGSFSYSKLVAINFDQPAKFTVNPNPVTDRLTIMFKQGSHFVSASLFDASGRLITKQIVSGGELKIDMQDLPRGLYILKLIDKEGNQENASFVKE